MSKNDDLFELIKSLAKPEKRFFKIYAGDASSNYVKLFDAIGSFEVYDEKLLKKKFSKEPFIKNFAYNKNYLCNLLLESLNRFNSGKSVESEICEKISSYESLMRKGLLKQAKKIVDRAYLLAKENEKNFFLPVLISYKFQLKSLIIDLEERSRYMYELSQEQSQLLEILQSQISYFDLASRMMEFMNVKGSIRNEDDRNLVTEILNNNLLRDTSSAKSLDDKCYYYFTKHLCYLCLGDMGNAYINSFEGVKLLKDADINKTLMRARLRTALGAHLLLLRNFSEKSEEFSACISMYRQAISPDKETIPGRFIDSYNSEILFNIRQGEYTKNSMLIKDIQNSLSGIKDINQIAEYYFLASNIAYCEFISGNYDNCRHWINVALDKAGEAISYQAATVVRVLSLILDYELGELDLLESDMLSAYRYLRSRQRLYKYEKLVLDFIRSSVKNITEEELIERFAIAQKNLKKISKEADEQKAAEPLDLISWLESKITGKSFIEVLKEKSNSIA